MFAIEPVRLAPVLLRPSQCSKQPGYGAPLRAEQMGQHMLGQFTLMIFPRPHCGLLCDDREHLFAQRAVFFSSGDGGASGRWRTIVPRS